MCHLVPNQIINFNLNTTKVLEKLYFWSSLMEGKQEICEEN